MSDLVGNVNCCFLHAKNQMCCNACLLLYNNDKPRQVHRNGNHNSNQDVIMSCKRYVLDSFCLFLVFCHANHNENFPMQYFF